MNRTGLKYYLRALGIGIIVTALLMGFSQKGQARMTDEEIRQRAAQLGMTESQGVLAELATAPPESGSTDNLMPPVEDPAGIGAEPASTSEPTEEPGTGTEPASTAEPTEEPGTDSAPTSSPAPAGDVATLVVTRGESSVTVSKNLEALGLVEDYWAFDRYLCENGYDHSISTGTYEIPMGLTGEEIARIICKQ